VVLLAQSGDLFAELTFILLDPLHSIADIAGTLRQLPD
jgi:hypothetical protein